MCTFVIAFNGDMNRRIEQLTAFLQDTPDDPFLLYALATEYVKTGETNEALRYYEMLRTNHPDYVGTYYHLGKLYEALGAKDKAISVYIQGMDAARKKRDTHALSELQGVYYAITGLDGEDDD